MNVSRRRGITVAVVVVIGLIGGCIWAGSKLALWDSVKKMWPDPWFKVTLVDLYTGFGLFGIFIAYREKSVVKSSLWMVLMAGLGNIASLIYLIIEVARLKPGHRLLETKRETWRLF